MTREKSGKNGKRGTGSRPPNRASTAPPESGPPTIENMKAAEVFVPATPIAPVIEDPARAPQATLVDAFEPERLPVDPSEEEIHGSIDDPTPIADLLPAEAPTELHAHGDEAVEIEDARALSQTHLRGLLEALVFASDKPMKSSELARLASAPVKQVKLAMAELEADYAPRGILLDEVAGGWLFRTNAQYAPFVRELAGGRPVKLSRAQLETLAIAAYRQPITRPEIDEIRGVDSGATLKLLLERDLVRILGKKDEPGRPLLYGTTTQFLEFFNMKSLRDLPTLREFTELSDESRRVAEAELGDVLPDMVMSMNLPEDQRGTMGPPAPKSEPAEGAPNADGPLAPAESDVPPTEDEWPDSAPPTEETWPEDVPTAKRPREPDGDG